MANPLEIEYLPIYYAAAKAANAASGGLMHDFYAACAACEAWCETGGQGSFPHMPMLADGTPSYNCLGIKTGRGYIGPSVSADGTEQLANGTFNPETLMNWRVYPNFQACFADQIKILHSQRNADGSLLYAAALAATTPEDYINAECPVWSTSLTKAQQVLATFHSHLDILAP